MDEPLQCVSKEKDLNEYIIYKNNITFIVYRSRKHILPLTVRSLLSIMFVHLIMYFKGLCYNL